MSEPAPAAEERRLAWLVLAGIAAVYLPSLPGDWVWDDVYQLRDNPAITQPVLLVTRDVWGPTGFADPRNTPVYRPAAMLSHLPGQLVWRGPASERLLGLALHLGAAALVAALALSSGAGPRAAWFGAACLGLHPAASEAVAWVSARADLLGAVLVLGSLVALTRRRPWLAGVLAGLAPFCKEPFVLVPLALGVWMLGLRRFSLAALSLSCLGVAAYFGARRLFDVALPGAGPAADPEALLGAFGAMAARGLRLLVDPRAPDALFPFAAHEALGVAVLLLALPLLFLSRGRPWLAAALATAAFLVPTAPASLANGFVSDRYFYVWLGGCAAGAAFAYAAVERRSAAWAPLLFALPLCWAPFTALRALDWTGNEPLFRAAVARHPGAPEPLFHLAYALHVGRGDCEAAIPLYDRAASGSLRAGNNLQACLFETGRHAEAAELGPELATRDPENPTPALNTGRALSLLGDQDEAERWAREGLRRDPRRVSGWLLLGNVLGIQGRYAEAIAAFDGALALSPGLGAAERGRSLAERRLAAGS